MGGKLMSKGFIGQWYCGLTTDHAEAMIRRCPESRSLYLECPECGYCSVGIVVAEPPRPTLSERSHSCEVSAD